MENNETKKNITPVLPKETTAMAELTQAKDDGREVLKYLRVESKAGKVVIAATDAHIAGVLEIEATTQEEYPLIPGQDGERPDWDALLLHRTTVEAMRKGMPKKSNISIPVLQELGVVTKIDTQSGIMQFGNTDLAGANVVSQRVFEGQFPNIENVKPKDSPVFEITLGLPVLEKMVKVMKKLECGLVDFQFHGQEQAVKATAEMSDGRLEIYMMPIRSG